jgi:hypothetical protein
MGICRGGCEGWISLPTIWGHAHRNGLIRLGTGPRATYHPGARMTLHGSYPMRLPFGNNGPCLGTVKVTKVANSVRPSRLLTKELWKSKAGRGFSLIPVGSEPGPKRKTTSPLLLLCCEY